MKYILKAIVITSLFTAVAVSQETKESAEHQYAQLKLNAVQPIVDDFHYRVAIWFSTHSLARRLGNMGSRLDKEYERKHIE